MKLYPFSKNMTFFLIFLKANQSIWGINLLVCYFKKSIAWYLVLVNWIFKGLHGMCSQVIFALKSPAVSFHVAPSHPLLSTCEKPVWRGDVSVRDPLTQLRPCGVRTQYRWCGVQWPGVPRGQYPVVVLVLLQLLPRAFNGVSPVECTIYELIEFSTLR